MKLSLTLLPSYVLGGIGSILSEIGVNRNEIQPLRFGFDFDQTS